jgi:hypothetical protein
MRSLHNLQAAVLRVRDVQGLAPADALSPAAAQCGEEAGAKRSPEQPGREGAQHLLLKDKFPLRHSRQPPDPSAKYHQHSPVNYFAFY